MTHFNCTKKKRRTRTGTHAGFKLNM